MDVLRTAAPYLAYGFLSLTGWTSRLTRVGVEHLERVREEGKGWIYALWHQRQAFLTYTNRREGSYILVSRSRDGEIIAKVLALSGIHAVRGSSSRGAAVAAKELVELGRAGSIIGITPDGPKGPAREVKPGALFLARATGQPIIPLASALSRRLELRKAWDRFQVPLPFSRACVVYGPPLYVREGDDLDAKARELKESIDRITAEADRRVA